MDKFKILVIEDQYKLWDKVLKRIYPESQYLIFYNKGDKDLFSILQSINCNISDLDLIICDYYLDNFNNGVEWVKKNVKGVDPFLPVIFWTSSMDADIIKETVTGEHVFFKKQLNLDNLKNVSKILIQQRINQKKYPLYNEKFNIWIKSDNYRRLCHNAYINASRYLESFFGHSKYHTVFNAHGLIHVQNVLNNTANLMMIGEKYFDEEYFLIAYLSVIFHDMGMIPQRYDDNLEMVSFRKIRKDHCKKIFYWLLSGDLEGRLNIDFSKYNIQNIDHIKYKIASVCLFHDCNYPFREFFKESVLNEVCEWMGKEGLNQDIVKSYNISISKDHKLKTLAGLVALADKLDYGISRVPIIPIRNSPHRGIMDEFEYIKNECLDSYRIIYSHEGPVIKILIKKLSNYIEAGLENNTTKQLFKKFELRVNENDGRITDTVIQIASYDLEKNVIENSWNNIRDVFINCNNKNLQKININIDYKIDKEILTTRTITSDEGSHIEYIGETPLDIYQKSLIHHIFRSDLGYSKVVIRHIYEGFSDDMVMFLESAQKRYYNDKTYEVQNKFIKIGKYERIHKEYKNYYNIALPFIKSRSLVGALDEYKYLDNGAIMGSVITRSGRVQSLDKKIIDDNYDNISRYINESINIFYENIKPDTSVDNNKTILNKYHELFRKKNDKLSKMEEIGERERNTINDECGEILQVINLIKKNNIPMSLSYMHGDFTFRNILITDTDELIFIDFAESDLGHYYFDFAKLDHYIRYELLNYNEISNIVGIETCIIQGNDYDYDDYSKLSVSVSSVIREILTNKVPKYDNQIHFELEYNLSKLYINFWSLIYTEDFKLPLNKRIDLIKLYREHLETLVKKLG